MNYLILGGGGFIGSHIAETLIGKGNKVRIFERVNINTFNLNSILSDVELITGDFQIESDLSRALQGIDIVFHLISTTLPKTSNDNPFYDVESNVLPTINLLNLALRHGVKKIVFFSSGGTIYGPSAKCPILENSSTSPLCSYGITKLTIEKYLYLYHHLHGLEYVVLRVANPFGERQSTNSGQGVIAAFLWKILKGEPITVWGDGTSTRDYIYISDLVSAAMCAIESTLPSRIYNIGSGVPISINELLKVMEKVTGLIPRINYTQSRKFDVDVNYLNISLALKELSWMPKLTLDQGLDRTWSWIKNNAI